MSLPRVRLGCKRLRPGVPAPDLCTLDDLSADVDDPDLKVDLDEEAAA